MIELISLEYMNLLIIPALVYLIKIERRLAKGDSIFAHLKNFCPIINLYAKCPNNFYKKGGGNSGEEKESGEEMGEDRSA